MTTDISTTEDAPIDAPPPSPPWRTSWVATLVTITGVILVGIVVLQAVSLGLSTGSGTRSASYTADVEGVTSLDIGVSAGDLTVTFADVDEAQLDVTGSGWRDNTDWRLEVDDGRLVVREDDGWWFFWPNFGSSRTTADLVLPSELEGTVAADLDVSSGEMSVDGDLQDVVIDVSAGSLTFIGASTSLDVEVSAGNATVVTQGPDEIDARVSAGRFTGTVTGAPPSRTTVEVSAGDAVLDLPDAEYAVSGDVSAGDRTIDVRTDPSSPNLLHVQVSAGDATIGYSD
jgi:hypothetical protein